jgi:hypothetical protein
VSLCVTREFSYTISILLVLEQKDGGSNRLDENLVLFHQEHPENRMKLKEHEKRKVKA